MKNKLYLSLILILIFVSCNPGEQKIIKYIETDNVEALKKITNSKPEINFNEIFDGSNPIVFTAIDNKSYKVLNFLLQNGIKNIYYGDSINILGYAIFKNDTSALKIILKYFQIADSNCYFDENPLIYAVRLNKPQIVEILYNYSIFPDTTDQKGNSAIFYAQNTEILKILLKNNAKTSLVNYEGLTFQQNAKNKNYTEILDYLNHKVEIKFNKIKSANWLRNEISFEKAIINIVKRKRMPIGEYLDGMYDIEFNGKHNYKYLFLSDTTKLIKCSYNAFFYAMELAYYEERPVVISPDMIWLLICQGVSQHIELNSEKLRDKLVDFENKKEIKVFKSDLDISNKNDWAWLISEFATIANSQSIDTLYKVIKSNFSTTTFSEEIAFQVTYLDIMKNYFNYCWVMCGIPSITIEGTTEDWQKIYEKVDFFRKYELDWWIDSLKPCLKQFVEASKGNIDSSFWESMVKNKTIEDCGDVTFVNGWILNLFPYKYGFLYSNDAPHLIIERNKDITQKNKKGLEYRDVLSGVCLVPFVLDDGTNKHNLEFASGFIGIEQDEKTKTLRPKIGFGILQIN